MQVWRPPVPPSWAASDSALIAAIREADGRVFIGIRPAGAGRIAETGVAAAMTAQQVRDAWAELERHEVRITRRYRFMAAVAAEIEPDDAPGLAALAVVNYVEPIRPFELASSPAVDRRPRALMTQTMPWSVERVGAPAIWSLPSYYGYANTGSGRAIRILDTGIDTSLADFKAPGVGFECWWGSGFGDCQSTLTLPHGSQVASAAAARHDGGGVVGAAHSPATLGSYRVCTLTCDPDDVAEALAHIDSLEDPGIVVMSFGTVEADITFSQAVAQAYQTHGHLLVAAAGNTGGGVLFPASDTNVVAVTGTNRNDSLSTAGVCGGFKSNYGTYAELAAPFDSVPVTTHGGSVIVVCGTSFSAPYVAGVAALLWTAVPTLTNVQVRQRLRETAYAPAGWQSSWGDGRVDAVRALTLGVGVSTSSSGCDSVTAANTVCVFEVDVTRDNGSLSYAWYKRVGQGAAWTLLSGVTGTTFTDTLDPTFEIVEDPYEVRVLATDAWDLVGEGILTVRTLLPSLTLDLTSPCDSMGESSGSCTFTATTSQAEGTISYAWSQKVCDTCGWQSVGTNSSTYQTTVIATYDPRYDPFMVKVVVEDDLFTRADTLTVRTLYDAGPLDGELYGPLEIPADTPCLFTASVAYGTPPYVYRWYMNQGAGDVLVGDEDTYWANESSPFTLTLYVWDQRPDTIMSAQYVAIEPTFCLEFAPPPPEMEEP